MPVPQETTRINSSISSLDDVPVSVSVPIPQVAAAPAPSAAEALAIQEATDAVTKSQKRLKCTSYTLMVLGLLGVITSFVHGFGARGIAEKIVNKGKKPEEISPLVTRDEFALYDTFLKMSCLSFLLSFLVICLGRCGKKSTRWMRSMVVRRNMYKSLAILVVMILLAVSACRTMHGAKPIMDKYRHGHHSYHGNSTVAETNAPIQS